MALRQREDLLDWLSSSVTGAPRRYDGRWVVGAAAIAIGSDPESRFVLTLRPETPPRVCRMIDALYREVFQAESYLGALHRVARRFGIAPHRARQLMARALLGELWSSSQLRRTLAALRSSTTSMNEGEKQDRGARGLKRGGQE